jgi:DNA repair exonuclease SbcCD ATPase subunit
MPLFSLFSGKKDDKQLEQTCREFISQIQALRQDIQAMQQSLIEEMRQLSSSINTSHAKQLEQVQALIEGVRRSSKSTETLRESIDKLHSLVSQIRPLSDAIASLQEQVKDLSERLPFLPAGERNIDNLFRIRSQSAVVATSAVNDFFKARDAAQQAIDTENQIFSEVQGSLYSVMLTAEQNTGEMRAIESSMSETD